MEDITIYEVAEHINISPFYFQKGFSILCGYSIAEYIRNRRMALAGEEWITSKSVFRFRGIEDALYENAKQEVPLFWQEHYTSGKGEEVCGMFGINIDLQMGNKTAGNKIIRNSVKTHASAIGVMRLLYQGLSFKLMVEILIFLW